MTRLTSIALGVLAVAAAACGPGAKGAPPASTPPAGSALAPSIVEPYLKIHEALARDSVDDVKANAGAVATAAAALGAPAMKIDTAALQLAAAADLADARTKFGALSEAMVVYMNGLHLTPPAGVRVAFCPMVQTRWLQRGSTIANPYFGSQMPTCGEFR